MFVVCIYHLQYVCTKYSHCHSVCHVVRISDVRISDVRISDV